MISYWFSEATKQNQIGPILKCLVLLESSTAWGDMPDSPKAGSFFRRTLRNLLGFAVSEETGYALILSFSTFALRLFSLLLVFCTWESLSFTWMGSSLASDPCVLDLKDLLLLATSTKQFKGFQRSNFASHGSAPFSVPLLGMDWLPSQGDKLCAKQKFKHNISKLMPIQSRKSNEPR